MSERKQKNFRFRPEALKQMQNILDKRDKNRFEFEGDLIAQRLIEGDMITEGDPYYLEKTCANGSLIKHGLLFICSRGGKVKTEKAKVKKPWVFKVGKAPMSFEGVKKICSECYYTGAALEEDMEQICFKGKLIKEPEGFVCIGGGPCTHLPESPRPYLFQIEGEALPLEMIRRICNGGCMITNMHNHNSIFTVRL